MKEIKEFLKINTKQKVAKGIFRIVEFEDNGHHIVYVPSLNLSAYGDTQGDAREMMHSTVLDDFFETLFAQPENIIFETMKNLGWEKSTIYPKELSHDVHIDRDGILKNFNLSEETKITKR